jgi:hypothetical protein
MRRSPLDLTGVRSVDAQRTTPIDNRLRFAEPRAALQ